MYCEHAGQYLLERVRSFNSIDRVPTVVFPGPEGILKTFDGDKDCALEAARCCNDVYGGISKDPYQPATPLVGQEQIGAIKAALYSDGHRSFLAVRGSGPYDNWIANFKMLTAPLDPALVDSADYNARCSGVRVHVGIQRYARRLLPFVARVVEPHLRKAGGPIYVVGHSLGGAIATLLAVHLSSARGVPKARVRLATFAACRLGNGQFAELCEFLIGAAVICVNSKDIVPTLPPTIAPIGTYVTTHPPIVLDQPSIGGEAIVHFDASLRKMLCPMESILAPMAMTVLDLGKCGTKLAHNIHNVAAEHSMELYIDQLTSYLGSGMLRSSSVAATANIGVDDSGIDRSGADIRLQDLAARQQRGFVDVQSSLGRGFADIQDGMGKGFGTLQHMQKVNAALSISNIAVSAIGFGVVLYGLHTVKREVGALRKETNEGVQQLQTSLLQLDKKVDEGVERICTEMKNMKEGVHEDRIRDRHADVLGSLNGLRRLTSLSTPTEWASHKTAFLNCSEGLLEHVNSTLLPQQHALLQSSCFTLATAHVIALDWLLKMERSAECSSLLGATVDLCELAGKLLVQQAFVLVLEEDYLPRIVFALQQAFALATSEVQLAKEHDRVRELMHFLDTPSRESGFAVQLQAAALQPFDPRTKLMVAATVLREGAPWLPTKRVSTSALVALITMSALSDLTGAEGDQALDLLRKVEISNANFASWAEAYTEWLKGLEVEEDSSLAGSACQLLGQYAVLPSLGEQTYIRIQSCARLTLGAFAQQPDVCSSAQLVLASVGRKSDKPQLTAQTYADVATTVTPPVFLELSNAEASCYNVVIFGPSGAGKSTIAGLLFAKRFAKAEEAAGVQIFRGSHFSAASGWVTVNVYVVPWSHQRPRPSSSPRALLRLTDDATVEINRLVFVLDGRLTTSLQEDLDALGWLDQPRQTVAKARNFSTLLILNRCDDRVAMSKTHLDELKASLELPAADGLCLPSFAHDVGPSKRDYSALTEALLSGIAHLP